MATSPIHFGTSGWRGIIAEDFTFASVRLAVAAIAAHVLKENRKPCVLVAHDRRFFSEEFARTAAIVLQERGVRPLLATAPVPTPAVAYEVPRRRLDGAINFTASHNPAEYHGLKFSGPDGAPALPSATRDIEARAGKLAAAGKAKADGGAFPGPHESRDFERCDPSGPYLARLGELVRFESLHGLRIVYDAMHGCGAGYLDRALAEHGIPARTIRGGRDVLFDGAAPDVSAENLATLAAGVPQEEAQLGMATDGDADRFGIIDDRGEWVSPNHILGLLYDYLVESRGWRMPAARSVGTSHLVDAVARYYGVEVHQTPVGFKYIGQWIAKDAVALGGEEAAGLSIRGHLPDKDGILACLLVAEMVGARQASLGEQLQNLFRKVGREYWPLRINLALPHDVKTSVIERLQDDYPKFLGRRVVRTDRTDGLKLIFGDGDWIMLRLSGTEPLLRIYTEAATREQAARLAEQGRAWVFSAASKGAAS